MHNRLCNTAQSTKNIHSVTANYIVEYHSIVDLLGTFDMRYAAA